MTLVLPVEPLIIEGRQGFADAQAALAGTVDTTIADRRLDVGWYGSQVIATRGCFAVVDVEREDLGGLVGDVLLLTHGSRYVYVYCVARAQVSLPLCISRRAFMALAPAYKDSVSCKVRVLV